MEDLKDIIKELKTYGLDVDDKTILENATKIFISQNIQRDRKKIETATEKQLNFLKNKGIKIPQDITKSEATFMIHDIMEKEKER